MSEWLSLSVCLFPCSCPVSAFMCALIWLSVPLSLMHSLRKSDINVIHFPQLSLSRFTQYIMQTVYFFPYGFHTAEHNRFSMLLAGWRVHQSIPTGCRGYFEREVRLKVSPQGHKFHVGIWEDHAYMKAEERVKYLQLTLHEKMMLPVHVVEKRQSLFYFSTSVSANHWNLF